MADWNALLQPCPGAVPAGENARYEPAHEELRGWMASLDTPTPDVFEWRAVEQHCEALLPQSKDLLIASYLVYARFQGGDWKVLGEGLRFLSEVGDTFWDGLHPKRPRARANALSWLIDRITPPLLETQVGEGDHDAVEQLQAGIAKLHAFGLERFDGKGPATRPLRDAAKRLSLSLPPKPEGAAPAAKSVDAPSPPVPQEQPAAATPTPTVPAPAPPTSQGEAPAPSAEAQPEVPASSADETSEPAAAAVSPAVTALLAPISEQAPVGADAKYEPEYEAVRAEVAKEQAPTGGEVDWPSVVQQSEAILKGKSKDLLIAAYWAYGSLLQRGFDGLDDGLRLLQGILETYGETAFPPKRREKARSAAVRWLLDRLERLSETALSADDAPAIARLEATAKAFSAICRNSFEKHLPPTRGLQQQVQRLQLSLPKPEPKPEPKPRPEPAPQAPAPKPAAVPQAAPRPAPQAVKSGAPAPAAVPLADGDLLKFLRETGAALRKASRLAFREDQGAPTAYLLSRVGLYLHIQQPPPSPDGKKTAVPPPTPKQVQQLEALLSNAKWAPLLDEAEGALARFRFWVDLHRLVALSLGNLGHEAAQSAVIEGTRSLIKRFPALVDMTFSNGQPFCSADTQAWLAQEVMAGGEGGGAAAASDSPDAIAIAEARALAVSGERDAAITALAALGRRASNARWRFEARLVLAETLGAAAAAVVDGLCVALSEEIAEHALERWHPELCARVYVAHLGACDALMAKAAAPAKPAFAEQRRTIHRRLCRVSPTAALAS